MKRQKTVYDTGEIARLWFHKTQESARNAQGNFYYSGDTIYSYGSHFPIARHATNAKGQSCVLLTTRTRSTTTRGHINMVEGAIPKSAPVFRVDNPYLCPTLADVRLIENSAAEFLAKANRAKTNKPYLLERAQAALNDAASMAEFFGIKYQAKNPDALKGMAAVIEKANQEKAKQDKAFRLKRQAAALAALEAWKLGNDNTNELRFGYEQARHFDTAFARISKDGKEIETTKGARIPLEHAVKAWPMVKRLIDNGESYHANGHTIYLGNYAITSINAQGNLTVGCHVFDKTEVLRIGKLLESV